MDELLSEKEQIEQIRNWWSDYGYYVMGGIVLGALVLFGFNYYQKQQANAEIEASLLYDALTESVAESDIEAAEASANELATGFGNSSYAAQSKLAMARLYMDENRDQDAASALRDLLAMDDFEPLRHVARIRLAKILLYQSKPEEVVTLLEGQDDAAFASRYAEIRGDAFVALGRNDEAREAYQAALRETQPTVDQGLIQLKLLDLPETVAVTEQGAATPGKRPDTEAEEQLESDSSTVMEDAGE